MRTTRELPWRARFHLFFKRKPKRGELFWFRADQHIVTKVDKLHMRMTAENVRFKITVSLREVLWSDTYKMWHLPGREGTFVPRIVHGELVIPREPTGRPRG